MESINTAISARKQLYLDSGASSRKFSQRKDWNDYFTERVLWHGLPPREEQPGSAWKGFLQGFISDSPFKQVYFVYFIGLHPAPLL